MAIAHCQIILHPYIVAYCMENNIVQAYVVLS